MCRKNSPKFYEKYYVLNVNGGPKSKFSSGFKIEPIITYHLGFVMKVLWV